MAITIYGLKNCDSCRKARKYLDNKGVEYTFHDVRQDGLDEDVLSRWLDELGWEVLLNRKSLTWRQIPEDQRADLDRQRALALMVEHPTLVKRPVVDSDAMISVGYSEERLDTHAA